MTTLKTLRASTALCFIAALSACNSATPPANMTAPAATPATMVATSGMTPTAASTNSFVTAFDASNAQLATTTPMTGTASYTGEVEVHTTTSRTDPDNVVYGDLAMDVNFGGAASPITATVSNIEGHIGGVDTKVTGTISSAGSSGINQVVALPVLGTTATSISVRADGALADPTGTLTGNAQMTFAGTVRDTNGASNTGSNSVGITETGGANKRNTGGRFYADR